MQLKIPPPPSSSPFSSNRPSGKGVSFPPCWPWRWSASGVPPFHSKRSFASYYATKTAAVVIITCILCGVGTLLLFVMREGAVVAKGGDNSSSSSDSDAFYAHFGGEQHQAVEEEVRLYSTLSFRQRRIGINASLASKNKIKLDNFMVVGNVDDLCSPPPSLPSSEHDGATRSSSLSYSSSILPRCPMGTLSYQRLSSLDTKLFSGEKRSPPLRRTNEAQPLMHGELQSAGRGGAFGVLTADALASYMFKLMKLVLTNRACDEAISLAAPSPGDVEELARIVRNEHNSEFTVLNVGDVCMRAARHQLDLFSALGSVGKHRAHDKGAVLVSPHLNIMNLNPTWDLIAADGGDGSGEQEDKRVLLCGEGRNQSQPSFFDTRAERSVSEGTLAVPSGLVVCYYKNSGASEGRGQFSLYRALSAMPPHTFNAVLAFDGLLASVPNDLLCETVRALLRVTKIGGAVWVGHEADGERVRILSECNVGASADLPLSRDVEVFLCPKGVRAELTRVSMRAYMSKIGLPRDTIPKTQSGYLWRWVEDSAKVQQDNIKKQRQGERKIENKSLLFMKN